MSAISGTANRAEGDAVKTHAVERFQTSAGGAPAELVASRLQALEPTESACEAGMSLGEMQTELLQECV